MQNNTEGMAGFQSSYFWEQGTEQDKAEKGLMGERVYAGFFVRLAAYLIDWLVVGIGLLVIRIPVWIGSFSGSTEYITRDLIFRYSIYDILLYVIKVTYFVLLTYYTGSTLGKKLFHLKVVSTENRKPTLFEIIYRESVGKFLSGLIFSIGYILVGIDKKKMGIHDHLADTCVIYQHKKIVYVAAPIVNQEMPYFSTPKNRQGTAYGQQFSGQQFSGQQFSGQQPYGQPAYDRQMSQNQQEIANEQRPQDDQGASYDQRTEESWQQQSYQDSAWDHKEQ